MDSFRAQIAVMQSYEDAQLTERLEKSATARQEALISTVSMSVIAAGLVLWGTADPQRICPGAVAAGWR